MTATDYARPRERNRRMSALLDLRQKLAYLEYDRLDLVNLAPLRLEVAQEIEIAALREGGET